MSNNIYRTTFGFTYMLEAPAAIAPTLRKRDGLVPIQPLLFIVGKERAFLESMIMGWVSLCDPTCNTGRCKFIECRLDLPELS